MRLSILILALFVFGGCKKDSPPPQSIPPQKVTLVFPDKDAVCTEGKVMSSTESVVNFTWNSAENTDVYEISIKNLFTGQNLTKTTKETGLEVTLLRNTPYAWSVTSRSQQHGVSAQSEVWRFYNSGPGVIKHAPFPAEIISPVMGQLVNAVNLKIKLDWNGNDVDNDLSGYDLYFGSNTSPELFQSNLTESALDGINVMPNTTYYWKVITKDSAGNTSDSGIFQFKVIN